VTVFRYIQDYVLSRFHLRNVPLYKHSSGGNFRSVLFVECDFVPAVRVPLY